MATGQVQERIAGILAKRGAIDPAALKEAEADARAKGMRLEKYLTERKLVRSEDMLLVLAEYLHMPPMSLERFSPNAQLLNLLPKETMARRLVVPIAQAGKTLTVGVGDPFDLMALDEVRTMTGMEVVPCIVSEDDVGNALSKIFAESSQGLDMEEMMRADGEVEVVGDEEEGDEDQQSLDEMLEKAEGAPVIRMVNMILVEALRTAASDIHIEPMEKQVRLRYRIDGVLQERPGPPKNLQAAVISRIKIMSDLDIAERRKPQDGRFNIKALGTVKSLMKTNED